MQAYPRKPFTSQIFGSHVQVLENELEVPGAGLTYQVSVGGRGTAWRPLHQYAGITWAAPVAQAEAWETLAERLDRACAFKPRRERAAPAFDTLLAYRAWLAEPVDQAA